MVREKQHHQHCLLACLLASLTLILSVWLFRSCSPIVPCHGNQKPGTTWRISSRAGLTTDPGAS